MKNKVRSILPEWVLGYYHWAQTFLALCWYRFPAKKLTVIGITGTKGKTSTADFIWSMLSSGGYKTGLIGTAVVRIGDETIPNRLHMTMPGPWVLQKLLRRMVDQKVTHVVMEVTSEGLKLKRHKGIPYRIAVFTNLSPEHLASHHDSFDEYKKTKGLLFQQLQHVPESIAIINADAPDGEYYASFPAKTKILYGIKHGELRATECADHNTHVSFSVDGFPFQLSTLGLFNIYNALPAIAIGRTFGIPNEKIAEGLRALRVIPGRMEEIIEGQPFRVIVDYAHEQLSINTLLDTAQSWRKGDEKIIVIIGAEGGGRDPRKREHMGRAAGIKADYVIVTTTDPYDDDPQELANKVTEYVVASGKESGKTVFTIVDRYEGLQKAFHLAGPNDIVLATGMGAQETMIVKGKAVPWDERAIIRTLLKTYSK